MTSSQALYDSLSRKQVLNMQLKQFDTPKRPFHLEFAVGCLMNFSFVVLTHSRWESASRFLLYPIQLIIAWEVSIKGSGFLVPIPFFDPNILRMAPKWPSKSNCAALETETRA